MVTLIITMVTNALMIIMVVIIAIIHSCGQAKKGLSEEIIVMVRIKTRGVQGIRHVIIHGIIVQIVVIIESLASSRISKP